MAYEQEIGRRLPGQQSDGTFQVSLSRTSNHSQSELLQAWITFAAQNQYIRKHLIQPAKTGGTAKRLRWQARSPKGWQCIITIEAKPTNKSMLVARLTGFTNLPDSLQAKKAWTPIINQFLQELV